MNEKENKDLDVGMELRLLRTRKNVPLREVSDKINVSENYLSHIERGTRTPSDQIIKDIAKYYGLDEAYLFDRFNRVPISVIEELRSHRTLQDTLYEISKNSKLDNAQKEIIYKKIQDLYMEALEE